LAETPLFFPAGLEYLFLLIYIVTLPYIFGLLFLFLYVVELKVDLFISLLNKSSFFAIWAIGYEILAAIILLLIFKSAITYNRAIHKTKGKRRFIIP